MEGAGSNPHLKKFMIILIILTVVSVLLQLISLAIENWMEYCFWTFGLHQNQAKDGYEGSSDNIVDLYDNLCENDDNKEVIQAFCSGFCSNLERIKAAGIIMILFGVASLLLQLVVTGLAIMKLRTPEFDIKYGKLAFLISAACFSVGFLLYISVVSPASIRSASDSSNIQTYNYQALAGTYFALFVCFYLWGIFFAGYKIINRSNVEVLEVNEYLKDDE